MIIKVDAWPRILWSTYIAVTRAYKLNHFKLFAYSADTISSFEWWKPFQFKKY